MTPYRNASGHSGVVAFEASPGAITVECAEHVARMQQLAASGQGLATYIAKHVREHYARRVR